MFRSVSRKSHFHLQTRFYLSIHSGLIYAKKEEGHCGTKTGSDTNHYPQVLVETKGISVEKNGSPTGQKYKDADVDQALPGGS